MTQPIKSLFSNHQELRAILDKAQILTELHRQFTAVAPKIFFSTTQILGLKFGTLSVAVANATLAAKLRQITPEIITQLQDKGCAVSKLLVKVQVSFDQPQPHITPQKLSRTAQNRLSELSLTLDNSPLKSAIEKLSNG
ncbi:MAG: DciA family protein [Gallionella sp.]|nr:DUF721 domain-containing protein [Gallionella sp.]